MNKKTNAGLFLLLLLALCLLPLTSLWRPMWLDEFTTALTLGQPTLWAAMQALRQDTHHPLYFALLYAWHSCFACLWADRCLGALLHAASLTLLGRIATKLQGLRAAAWATALFGLSPLALRAATELRPYALLLLTTLWALHATYVHLLAPSSRGKLAGRSLAYLALVLTHPVGFLYLAAMGTCEAAFCGLSKQLPNDRQTKLQRGLASLPAYAVAGLSFGAVHWLYSLHQGNAGLEWMPPFSWRLVGAVLASFVGTNVPGPLVTGCLCLFAGAALGLALPAARALLCVIGTYFTVVAAYSVAVLPIFYYRSMLPLLPTCCLVAGLGLAGRSAGFRRLCQLGAVWLLVWQGLDWARVGPLAVDQAHAVNEGIAALLQPGERIWIYPDWYATTVLAEVPAAQLGNLRALVSATAADGDDQAPAFSPAPAGIAVLRLDGYDPKAGGAPIDALARLGGHFPHDLWLYVSDGDDVLLGPAERRQRVRQTSEQIRALQPGCEVLYLARDVVQIRCQPA